MWTFDFNFGLVSNTSKSPVILRVILELLELNNTSSLFAVSSKERFQHIRIIGRNNSDQANVSVNFDHVYSGHYKLKVEECRSRFSCFQTIHESDLGVVSTDLTNIDVARMNISIRTTPTEIGGMDVSFAVLYFNVSNAFLPFEEFMVSLISVDGVQSFSRRVIGETKAEFRSCRNNNDSSVSTDCYQLVNGQYITRIDPIDSRCNYQKQVVASIKRPCRRYIFTNINVIPSGFFRFASSNELSRVIALHHLGRFSKFSL
ncbi:uncharacterized protein LOC124210418 isoform X2 [Daphnia pulex]|nr:uncharacterized protein LOC124210411 isoform X2 [Daphnia pulex]XP_046464430.1 uncharacterized protein LOC124210418 isoform X2 [Daphnia pulex]